MLLTSKTTLYEQYISYGAKNSRGFQRQTERLKKRKREREMGRYFTLRRITEVTQPKPEDVPQGQINRTNECQRKLLVS